MVNSSAPKPMDWGTLGAALSQLFRLSVSGVAALAGSTACYAINPTLPFLDYLLTGWVLACMTGAACAINDYWDVQKDSINHPDRPLPSGLLTLRQAWFAAIVTFSCAVIAAIPLGKSVFWLVMVSTLLLWNYSHILRYSGILGNLVVATIIALLILLGSIVAGRPLAMLYPMGFLFCYALARELIWDVHDAEGDREQGIKTIANCWGAPAAFLWTWGLLGLLLGSIPIALWLPMTHAGWFVTFTVFMLLCFGIPLAFYQQQQSESRYRQLVGWERLGLLLGILGLLGTAPSFSLT
ncbi:MAG: UbiA family prenyltransferase [Acaryochloridaceae cyanobacterium RU_4_10]|nr:UbiA family prenyltransferase [Acaryochloridaceae cyanobacterium RU_4_10]